MEIVEKRPPTEHKRVLFCSDPSVGYRGMIAVHSTALGPAVGGTRFWHYVDDEEALADLLRLSRGMTYKNALAGLPFGGGKSIIMKDQNVLNREQLFRAHGRFVDTLGGLYITGEDVGTSPADMSFVQMETSYVAGLKDPSPATALGVFRAIQAAAKHCWDIEDLTEKTVALQGCGNVGYHLAAALHQAGARLIATDVDSARLARVVNDFGASPVAPGEIYQVDADIFAPCALGGIINDETIPKLRVEVIAGAANNQLLEARHGELLEERDILYAPDYVANAGGMINGCIELLGWDSESARKKVMAIYETMLNIFAIAAEERIPTYRAADQLAEQRLNTEGVR